MEPDIVNKVLETVESRREETIRFLQELVRAPSVTGSEGPCSKVCARKLRELRLDVDEWETDFDQLKDHPAYNNAIQYPPSDFPLSYSNRPNVVGVCRGASSGRSLILNGHMDVVSPEPVSEWTHDPWGGEVEGGKLYGRGAADMKGGIAAMVMALESILEAGLRPRGTVIIECVIEEEGGVGNGTLSSLLRGYNADACIVTEGTGLKICSSMRAGLYWRITARGKSSHGVQKWLGVDAIQLSAKILQALAYLETALSTTEHHSLYEHQPIAVPITPDKIRGGIWKGMIAPECVIQGYFEPLPGKPIEHWENVFRDFIKQTSEKDPLFQGIMPKVEFTERYKSYELPPDDPFVTTMREAYKDVLGSDADVKGSNGGCDASVRALEGGASTVIFGPGGGNAHGVDEFSNIDQLIECEKIIASTILRWCGYEKA